MNGDRSGDGRTESRLLKCWCGGVGGVGGGLGGGKGKERKKKATDGEWERGFTIACGATASFVVGPSVRRRPLLGPVLLLERSRGAAAAAPTTAQKRASERANARRQKPCDHRAESDRERGITSEVVAGRVQSAIGYCNGNLR